MRNYPINSLSIVLPAYNEAENIKKCINNIVSYFSKRVPNYEVIVVNDGSTDQTAKIVSLICKKNSHIRLISHTINEGYGSTLRTGFKACKNAWIFYTDSDLQYDISDFSKLIPYIKNYDIVAGYRINRQDPLMRIFIANVYNFIVSTIFNLHIKDVDCSFKLYKSSVFKKISLTSQTGLIDAEIVIKALKKQLTIVQVGVNHFPRLYGKTIYEVGSRNGFFAFVRPSVILNLLNEIYFLKSSLLVSKKDL